MFKIDVDASALEKFAKQDLPKFREYLRNPRKFLWDVSKELTKSLKVEAPKWRGTLQQSIKVLPTAKNTVRAYSVFYGGLVRIPHRMGDVPTVKQWYLQKLGGTLGGYRKFIKPYLEGKLTRPNDFVERAIVRVAEELDELWDEYIKLVIKMV